MAPKKNQRNAESINAKLALTIKVRNDRQRQRGWKTF